LGDGRKLGRPLNDPDAVDKARLALGKGLGINRVAKLVGLSNDTVQRIKGEMNQPPNDSNDMRSLANCWACGQKATVQN
jgi:hypothetical protein